MSERYHMSLVFTARDSYICDPVPSLYSASLNSCRPRKYRKGKKSKMVREVREKSISKRVGSWVEGLSTIEKLKGTKERSER